MVSDSENMIKSYGFTFGMMGKIIGQPFFQSLLVVCLQSMAVSE